MAAVVAIDVVGYSRLMGADEAGTLTALRHLRTELFAPTIGGHNGTIIKSMGDGWLVEFASVVDAVTCAIEVQERLAGNDTIKLRIGVHLGDITHEDEDIYGDGVNIAARLQEISDPSAVVISDIAWRSIDGKLSAAFADLGEQNLKNIAEPVTAFGWGMTAVAADATARQLQSKMRQLGFFGRHAIAATLIVLIGLAGVGAWFGWSMITESKADLPPTLGSPKLSIAVLPFTNLSGDPDQDYFADAVTEDLTVDLSRISGSFVISRRTAATFRGQNFDTARVAQELGVRYLLEGTVRRGQGDVRVSVQLTDGETGQQLWSERYEKTTEDMYIFQNEVTGRVARALNLELKEAISRQAARGGAENLDANDLASQAWAELWTKPQKPETNRAAFDFANRALELDPENAEALGVIAYAYARAATYGWVTAREEAVRKGIEAGEKSVALDPKNTDAVYALGFLYYRAGDTRKSQEMMRQCIVINRNHAPAYFFSGVNLIRLGKPREAILWVERAFVLSPRDPLRSVWYGIIGRAQVAIGEDAQAVETSQKGIAANPKHPHNYAVLASALAHLGKMTNAKAALEKFEHSQSGITLTRYRDTVASSDPIAIKTYRRLLDGLSKAGLNG